MQTSIWISPDDLKRGKNHVRMAHPLLRSFPWQKSCEPLNKNWSVSIKAAGSPSSQLLILILWSTCLSRLLLPLAPTLIYIPSIVPLCLSHQLGSRFVLHWLTLLQLKNSHRIKIHDKPLERVLDFSVFASQQVHYHLTCHSQHELRQTFELPRPDHGHIRTCTSARRYTVTRDWHWSTQRGL